MGARTVAVMAVCLKCTELGRWRFDLDERGHSRAQWWCSLDRPDASKVFQESSRLGSCPGIRVDGPAVFVFSNEEINKRGLRAFLKYLAGLNALFLFRLTGDLFDMHPAGSRVLKEELRSKE